MEELTRACVTYRDMGMPYYLSKVEQPLSELS